jgi:hypothetical protein
MQELRGVCKVSTIYLHGCGQTLTMAFSRHEYSVSRYLFIGIGKEHHRQPICTTFLPDLVM